MSGEPFDGFVWAVTLEGDEATRRAGASARERADAVSQPRSRWGQFVDRIADPKTDGRSWRRGAEGEEEVARRLAPLERRGWTILHDLPLGKRGANLDHLVIGPAGVFALNTKHLTGVVEVRARTLRRNGYSTDFYPKVIREAQRTADKLAAVLGAVVPVWPVLVLMGADVRVIQQPADLTVTRRKDVFGWLASCPPCLTSEQVGEIERAARRPSTWTTDLKGASSNLPDGITVKTWRRGTQHRLYVNNADGQSLGYLDRVTGKTVATKETDRPVVEAALRAHLRSAP